MKKIYSLLVVVLCILFITSCTKDYNLVSVDSITYNDPYGPSARIDQYTSIDTV